MNNKRTVTIIIIIFSFISIIAWLLFRFVPSINTIYDKVQTPMFTGFLTLGSFLLTLKTFIVVQIKEKLYDSDDYIERIAKLRFQNPKLQLYKPLAQLAEFLLIAVVMALTTSFLQVTLGFVGHQITSSICISFAIATLILVIFAWWQIRVNIYDLFTFWAEVKEKKVQEKQAELAPKNNSQNDSSK